MLKVKFNRTFMVLAFLTLGLVFTASMFTSTNAYVGQKAPLLSINEDTETETETETGTETGTETHGDDHDDDGIDDESEDKNERELDIELQPNEASIKSSIEANDTENEFELTLKTESDKLSIQFQYSTEVDDLENELEFQIDFTELIGYVDNDLNNIYNSDNDTLIRTYEIGDFLPIEYTFENRTDGEVHILSTTTTDGIFGVMLYATNEFTTVNGTLIAPTEIKFDIIIDGYNTTDITSIALLAEIEIEGDVEYDETTEDENYNFADDESELEFNIDDYMGFFSWSDTATVDSVDVPVYSNPFNSSPTERKLFLNYPAGDLIIHDPKIGMANILQVDALSPTPTLGFVLYTIAGISLLVALGVVSLLLRRTRWQKRN